MKKNIFKKSILTAVMVTIFVVTPLVGCDSKAADTSSTAAETETTLLTEAETAAAVESETAASMESTTVKEDVTIVQETVTVKETKVEATTAKETTTVKETKPEATTVQETTAKETVAETKTETVSNKKVDDRAGRE